MDGVGLNVTGLNATTLTTLQTNYVLFKTMGILHEFVLPVFITFGILGNMASILVFQESTLQKSSTSVYLRAMLVSDTGFLVSLIWPYLETKGVKVTQAPGLCQVIVYLSYVSAFLSVWFVVCITIENFITICYPTKIKTLCTVKRAKVVVFTLTSVCLAGYSATAIFTKSGQLTCHHHHYSEAIWRVIIYCDTVLTLLVPFIVLTVILTCITSTVLTRLHRRISKKRYKKTRDGSGVSERASSDEGADGRMRRPRKKSSLVIPQVRVARMLFFLSATVFIMSAPSHMTRLSLIIQSILGIRLTPSIMQHFVNSIFLFIYQSSFSIKAVIFFSCSTNFRKVLKQKLSACDPYSFFQT